MNFKYTHLAAIIMFAVVVFAFLGFGGKGVSPSPTLSPQASRAPKTSGCVSQGGLPDKNCTPGAVDSTVTQANIQSTICISGYTKTVRPPVSYTDPLKVKQIGEYGYLDTNPKDYEEDHLISLELAGSATSEQNLWPEPYNITLGAREKDKVENYLHKQVCDGIITLDEAQKEIAGNWTQVYQKIPH